MTKYVDQFESLGRRLEVLINMNKHLLSVYPKGLYTYVYIFLYVTYFHAY